MITLKIDGKVADIPADLSVSFVKENPFFTKSGEYTYDIEISLASKNNIAIFGSINRKDVHKEQKQFEAILLDGDSAIFEGIATIIGITDNSVSIQLLGGNAQVNYLSRAESLYIDELDLGYATEDIAPTVTTPTQLLSWVRGLSQTELVRTTRASVDDMPWVMLPAKNKESGKTVNNWKYMVNGTDGSVYSADPYIGKYQEKETIPNAFVQPYLLTIIRKVYNSEELGFHIGYNCLENSVFKNMYIPSVTSTLRYAKMLPHWSINEFTTQLENIFGVVFYFDSSTMTVDIRFIKEFSSSSVTHLNEVDDEYSVEISADEDGSENISASNLKFAGEYALSDRFDEALLDHTEIVKVDSYLEVEQWFADHNARIIEDPEEEDSTDTDTEESDDDDDFVKDEDSANIEEFQSTIVECNGRRYVWIGGITEADMLGDLIRKEDATVIDLKICPAPLTQIGYPIASTTWGHIQSTNTINTLVPEVSSVVSGSNTVNIEKYIGGEDYEENSASILPVAMYKGPTDNYQATHVVWYRTDIETSTMPGTNRPVTGRKAKYSTCTFSYPIIWTYGAWMLKQGGRGSGGRGDADTLNVTGERYPMLRLRDITGRQTLYSECHSENNMVRTNQMTQFTIYDEGILDPRNYYVTNGKKYYCEKIEHMIGITGVERKKIGTFYPVENK